MLVKLFECRDDRLKCDERGGKPRERINRNVAIQWREDVINMQEQYNDEDIDMNEDSIESEYIDEPYEAEDDYEEDEYYDEEEYDNMMNKWFEKVLGWPMNGHRF